MNRLQRAHIIEFFENRGWNLTCCARGGAKVTQNYLEGQFPQADIGILMIGSNDIDDGLSAYELLLKLVEYAYRFVYSGTYKHVIIMGLWPRNNRHFNNVTQYFNHLGWQLWGTAGITFWQWSKKLTVRLGDDGVHGVPNVYRRAPRFVLSGIMWVAKTKLQHFYFYD